MVGDLVMKLPTLILLKISAATGGVGAFLYDKLSC